jgi:hypothetical protein
MAVAELEEMIKEAVDASQLLHCPKCGHGFTEAEGWGLSPRGTAPERLRSSELAQVLKGAAIQSQN